jgi:hypothetical protein
MSKRLNNVLINFNYLFYSNAKIARHVPQQNKFSSDAHRSCKTIIYVRRQ